MCLNSTSYIVKPIDVSECQVKLEVWLNNIKTRRFLGLRGDVFDKVDILNWLEPDKNSTFIFGIFSDPSSLIGIYHLVVDSSNKLGILTVIVGSLDHWGKGVVSDTRPELVEWIFNNLPVEKICGSVFSNNGAALRNYIAEGWILDGIRSRHVIDYGVRRDLIHFAKFRDG